MLFRSYKYLLKLTDRQRLIFNSLQKHLYTTYTYLTPYIEKKRTASINEMRSYTAPLFERQAFTPMFTDIVFPQVLKNLQKECTRFESIFPLSFKQSSFNREANTISLPFCRDIKLSHSRQLPSKIYKTELYYKNNKWYINFLVSKKKPKQKNNNLTTIGIDVGLKTFASLSNGKSIKNPRFYGELKEKISIEQQKLSKKQYKSKRWFEQKDRINSLYTKLHNQRVNFLHTLSNYLTNTYDVIGIENINIQDLQRKKHLRNSLSDVSWGEFVEMLRYKCEEKGKHLIYVERFYPSSQLCSKCGSKRWMPVHIRTYQCLNCSNQIDRDYNAALNIENRAKQLYLETVHTV